MKPPLNQETTITKQLLENRTFRTEITCSSHYWFFHTYFNEYVKYPTALFQREMFEITEDATIKLAIIMAFRGSAKSTIMTLSFPIWAILGVQKKKFVVILSQTQQQAKMHLQNLKAELESNDLLRLDLGPFEERDEEWSSGSLVIPKHNARITALSMEQSIRGLRHGSHRPDLIICDDVEDLSSVKTQDSRNKTYNWLTGDVIPCGDRGTRVIIVGNLLHEDSLLMRLQTDIKEDRLDGIVRSFPLLDNKNDSLWPGKFPSKKEITELQRTVGSVASWHREYLLEIVSDAERVVHPEWVHHYEKLPTPKSLRQSGTGVDLAISQKQTADYTAMVSAEVHGYDDKMRIYIIPNPVNERLTFPETVEKIKVLKGVFHKAGYYHNFYVENVGYQMALIQHLQQQDIDAQAVSVGSTDKRARLALTSHAIQTGLIQFPEKGAEALINQLINLGVEKHDDLADAFSILILQLLSENHTMPRIYFLGGGRGDTIAGNMWNTQF